MDKTWINNLVNEFHKKVIEIENVWNYTGIINERYEIRSNSLKEHVYELLNDLLNEEYQHQRDVEKSIDSLINEVKGLSTDLKIECNCDVNGSLLERESILLTKKSGLMKIKTERMGKFHKLLELEDKLCQRIFEYKLALNPELIPSEYQLEQLQNKIKELEQIKIDRAKLYVLKRTEIIKYFSLLEKIPPKDAVIESVLGEDSVEHVPLSVDFLSQCDILINQLKAEYQKNITECTMLRNRYETLYKLLFPSYDEPINDYKSINSNEFTNRILNLLKSDVSKLEDIRRDRIPILISNLQTDIRKKLHKNFSSHLEFTDAYQAVLSSEENSECLLEQLEVLLEHWSKIERSLEPFHVEMENWNRLFNRLIEINKNLKDPMVLKNRGGILLKVEKDKNNVRKELPKTQSKLRAIIDQLNMELDKPVDLLFQGMTLDEFFCHSWDQFEGDKENKKAKTTKASSSVSIGPNAKFDSSKSSSSTSLSSNSKKPLTASKHINAMRPPQQPKTQKRVPEFKKPTPIDLTKGSTSKIPLKRYPLSPIPKQSSKTVGSKATVMTHRTNLDRRVSQSYNLICNKGGNYAGNSRALLGSTGDLYELFCKSVQGSAVMSSFVEFSP